MVAMLPATMSLGLLRMLGSYLDGRGKAFATSACSLLAGVAVVSLDLFLIPRLGVMGLALGALIGQSLALVAAGWLFCRTADIAAARAFLPRREDITMAVEVILRVLRRGTAARDTSAMQANGSAAP